MLQLTRDSFGVGLEGNLQGSRYDVLLEFLPSVIK